MPYESEKLKSRVFYYLCMVLAGCILANIVLRCDRNLQVFILPFTDSSRLAGVSVQQTLFYVLLQRTKQVAVVYLLYKVFPPKAVFSIGMSALLFLFGFVISCQMFYLGLSGVWFLLLCLFPHYLIYLPLWDSVYQMVYRESMGIWRNHGIFSTESKRLSPESALIYSFIRCGNSFGMACKSMDFKQNSGFFEIF